MQTSTSVSSVLSKLHGTNLMRDAAIILGGEVSLTDWVTENGRRWTRTGGGNAPGGCYNSRALAQRRSSSRWASHLRDIRLAVRGASLHDLSYMLGLTLGMIIHVPMKDEAPLGIIRAWPLARGPMSRNEYLSSGQCVDDFTKEMRQTKGPFQWAWNSGFGLECSTCELALQLVEWYTPLMILQNMQVPSELVDDIILTRK